MIDLGAAAALTLACCRGHALPEPLRVARAVARELRAGKSAND